jgi:hypothetical protein
LFVRPVSHPVATHPAAAATNTNPESFAIFTDGRTKTPPVNRKVKPKSQCIISTPIVEPSQIRRLRPY